MDELDWRAAPARSAAHPSGSVLKTVISPSGWGISRPCGSERLLRLRPVRRRPVRRRQRAGAHHALSSSGRWRWMMVVLWHDGHSLCGRRAAAAAHGATGPTAARAPVQARVHAATAAAAAAAAAARGHIGRRGLAAAAAVPEPPRPTPKHRRTAPLLSQRAPHSARDDLYLYCLLREISPLLQYQKRR